MPQSREGDVYAELFWKTDGGARIPLDVQIDHARPFTGSDVAAWEAEYTACVQPESHWLPAEEADAWDLFTLETQLPDVATVDAGIAEPDDTPFLMESL